MARIRAAVFDFDGTLAELTLDFEAMRRRIAAVAEAFLERAVDPEGRPVLELIELLSERIDAELPGVGIEFASRSRLLITAAEMDAAERGRLFPYSLELLQGLAGRGLGRGIITRNCTAAVSLVFPELRRHCEIFLAREDVPAVKPHPDHLLRAIRALRVEPGECLMIGDHVMDIQVAKMAGAMSAGVASGTMRRSELEAEGPDFMLEHAGELLAVLDALSEE